MQSAFNPEEVVQAAVAAVANRAGPARASFDDLPGALYVTDTEGLITDYNKACIDFAGRVPTLNRDRWCVTWKLFREDDSFLPHDQCPMAVAIRSASRPRRNGHRPQARRHAGELRALSHARVRRCRRVHWRGQSPGRHHRVARTRACLQEARRCRRLARTVRISRRSKASRPWPGNTKPRPGNASSRAPSGRARPHPSTALLSGGGAPLPIGCRRLLRIFLQSQPVGSIDNWPAMRRARCAISRNLAASLRKSDDPLIRFSGFNQERGG